MGEMSAIAELCKDHVAEFEVLHDDAHEHADDDHDHGKMESIGMLYMADCGDGHGDEHRDEEHSDEEHSDEEHAHDHGACDPHVWMNPHNVIYWIMLIRDTLVELDPANAETYMSNADAYILELDALMHDVIEPVADSVPAENRILITSHDSLGYFAAT